MNIEKNRKLFLPLAIKINKLLQLFLEPFCFTSVIISLNLKTPKIL